VSRASCAPLSDVDRSASQAAASGGLLVGEHVATKATKATDHRRQAAGTHETFRCHMPGAPMPARRRTMDLDMADVNGS
jgi:hypothetical protein